jgi:hypothetical protein
MPTDRAGSHDRRDDERAPVDADTTKATASGPAPLADPVVDEETGEELGEIAGGGDITDLAGDSPSS